MQPLVTIGTPFYNSEWSFNEYRKGITNLTNPKEKTEFVFIDHTSTDNTLELLKDFKSQHESKYHSIIVDSYPLTRVDVKSLNETERIFHDYTQLTERTRNIALIRNFIIEKKSLNAHLVFLDSDCIPPSDAIQRLLKMIDSPYYGDVCGGITIQNASNLYSEFSSCPKNGLAYLVTRDYTYYLNKFLKQVACLNFALETNIRGEIKPLLSRNNVVSLPQELKNKIIEVKFTGFACVLIKNTVLKSLQIDTNPSRHTFLSEDQIFCLDATKLGFKILVDTGLWIDHLHFSYEKSESQIILKGLNPKCPEYSEAGDWFASNLIRE